MGGLSVTKETVINVKKYLDKDRYPTLTYDEIAVLCNTSSSTVGRVVKGEYEHLLHPVVKAPQVNTDDVQVSIDYPTLKHLMACEYAVEAILNNSKLSTGYDGALFIDYKVLFGILKAYVLDDTTKRLEELREEDK